MKKGDVKFENLVKVVEYLRQHPCVDCGENNPIVLEFDHVNGDKAFTIGNSLHLPWHVIEAEIEKCEVRCSNCHKIVTAERDKWHRLKILKSLENNDAES